MNGLKFRCIAFNDCYTYSNEYILDGITTGIYDVLQKDQLITVFLNPSNGEITVSMYKNFIGPVTIQVFTTLDAKVFENVSIANEINLYLSAGSYFIRAIINSVFETKKLIISPR